MCKKLWENNIYEAELYQVSIRYRNKFDKVLIQQQKQQEYMQ